MPDQRPLQPSRFGAPDNPAADRACRVANLAWTWRRDRGRHRSHVDRLRALEAAGKVPNEAYFAQLAKGTR